MKAEASRSIKKCAYCSRVVKDQDEYTDLTPSGPVVYDVPSSLRPGPSLPILQVVCGDCQEERVRFALGDYGSPVPAGKSLCFQEARAAL
ncbi:MAG: hypothetical protein A3J27_06935 [Candidatus Tectomicrobia bacterium RIFCSPLOWO2_12_FULL_69_37]|nr:MAG: hypothetical protein A3I72_05115 [Candidatus Tectomicrobia bacterium RIFCSPLOWO2_02_FULL_70_19]OGL69640.1 MAG: hypothetical protein A3J27_06935 [Candidatus Tectomicrobia bacterium RIFCSPLOWO2_12_FULL_69_37]